MWLWTPSIAGLVVAAAALSGIGARAARRRYYHGPVSDQFDEFEINNEKLFKERANRMWGELLDQVIHSQVEGLKHLREEWKKEAAVGTQD